MRKLSHSLPLMLGLLALVIATTTSAFAATGQLTNIADGTHATYVAHVDSGGRLQTIVNGGVIGSRSLPANVPLNAASYVGTGTSYLIGPTTAQIAITRLGGINSGQNVNYANTTFDISLVKYGVDGSGACSIASSPSSIVRAPVGSSFESTFDASPLLFTSSGPAYCLGINVYAEATAQPGSYYLPFVQLTGYVVSGTYTGYGTATRQSRPARAGVTMRHGAAFHAG